MQYKATQISRPNGLLASLVVGFFLVSGCVNSPLSDVEITDPGLLKVQADVNHATSLSGAESSSIQVKILDKHHNTVELTNGKVLVNNVQATKDRDVFDIVVYEFNNSEVPVAPDKIYTFKIILADGKEYTQTVRSQQRRLKNLEVPQVVPRSEDLEITWEGGDNESVITVTLSKKSIETEQTVSATHTIAASSFSSYTVQSSWLQDAVGSVDVMIKSEKCGDPHPEFRNESHVCSTYRMYGIFAVVD